MTIFGKDFVVLDGLKTLTYGISQVIPSSAATRATDLRKMLCGMTKCAQGCL